MTGPTLDSVDRDESLTDALAALCGPTRAELLRRAALGGAAMLAALAAPSAAAAAKLDDTAILNFGLRFERLQATFYTEAEQVGTVASMSDRKAEWARTLGAHERAHVKIIKKVLGRKAEGPAKFDFGGDTESAGTFTRTAVAMEDLTVALLTGALPLVKDKGIMAAFFGLLTVEARHAAWARNIVGTTPAPAAFDQPRTILAVQRTIDRTHFVAEAPKMVARGQRPRFTG
jgi:Ferritin-like domain